jgi:hypothetical protein
MSMTDNEWQTLWEDGDARIEGRVWRSGSISLVYSDRSGQGDILTIPAVAFAALASLMRKAEDLLNATIVGGEE